MCDERGTLERVPVVGLRFIPDEEWCVEELKLEVRDEIDFSIT